MRNGNLKANVEGEELMEQMDDGPGGSLKFPPAWQRPAPALPEIASNIRLRVRK